MSDVNVNVNKPAAAIIAIVWLMCFVAIFLPEQALFPDVFQGVAIFLVVAHIIEMFIYKRLLDGPKDYLWVLFCGVLYIKPKAKALAKQRRAA